MQFIRIQSCANFFLSPLDTSSIWQVRKWIGVWTGWPLPPRHAVEKQNQKKKLYVQNTLNLGRQHR